MNLPFAMYLKIKYMLPNSTIVDTRLLLCRAHQMALNIQKKQTTVMLEAWSFSLLELPLFLQ